METKARIHHVGQVRYDVAGILELLFKPGTAPKEAESVKKAVQLELESDVWVTKDLGRQTAAKVGLVEARTFDNAHQDTGWYIEIYPHCSLNERQLVAFANWIDRLARKTGNNLALRDLYMVDNRVDAVLHGRRRHANECRD